MNKNLLEMKGFVDATIALLPDTETRRDELAKSAGAISKITDPFAAEDAAKSLQEISGFLKDIEAARTQVKGPVLVLSRKIDALAKDAVSSLVGHKSRISLLLGEYQAAERERIRKEEEAARQKAKDEAFRAESRIASATTDEEREQARQDGITKVSEAKQEAATIKAGASLKGTSIRTVYNFEVTDINKLYAARPELCEIVPRKDAIRAMIKYNQNIPGLKVTTSSKAVV